LALSYAKKKEILSKNISQGQLATVVSTSVCGEY